MSKKHFNTKKGYPPLFGEFESFWTRRIYKRLSDCWNRPVTSAATSRVCVNDRISINYCDDFADGPIRDCLNLGSYNYLGFSGTSGKCLDDVLASFDKFGISTCSPSCDFGYTSLHRELEQKTAAFLSKEDCLVFGMGYATNSSTLPALVGKGCLIISDSLNHASLIVGCRTSGAKIKVFQHNDVEDLERVIRKSIVEGQPRTHRPWKKILIIVEGIYSMEGEICKLKEIVELKKKYKCYLWLDEAHSIGALGLTGRGCCEHTGVDTKDIDILMGTYTKSFAGVGGYITGPKVLIDHLRSTSFAAIYSTSLTPGCCQQILTAMKILTGADGTNEGAKKLKDLKDNSNFFRDGLIARGFQVFGEKDSPIIPLMIFYPSKVAAFSRECLSRGLAVVVVGFPATPLLMSRARFCISAGHTKEELERALIILDEIGTRLVIKYGMEEEVKGTKVTHVKTKKEANSKKTE